MSLQEKLKTQPKTKVIMILGTKVQVPKMTRKQKRDWFADYEKANEKKMAVMFCDLFKKPSTGENLLEPEFVINDMTDEDALAMIKKVFEFDAEGIAKN